jgi:Spy/CpxP family protein refolding chaperone
MIAVVAGAAMIAAAGAGAQAQAPAHAPAADAAQARPRQRVQRPQLTEQQREQMRTLNERQRTEGEAARRELGDLHRQLEEALTAATVDTGKVGTLRSQIVQRETARAQQRVDRLSQLSSILTAEQRQSLRGRGLGQLFAPGARGFARGGGPAGGRGMMMRRGPGRGGQMGRQGRGMARGRMGDMRRRAEIRRLERQLDSLRRRIR